jgi:Mg2+ and Co2+ transporter CorA
MDNELIKKRLERIKEDDTKQLFSELAHYKKLFNKLYMVLYRLINANNENEKDTYIRLIKAVLIEIEYLERHKNDVTI